MLIPITLPPSSSLNPKLPNSLVKISNDEIVLIELQGKIEVESNHPTDRDGKLVGHLKMDNPSKPSLLIGHHLLEGKITALNKPLAVLARSAPKRKTDGRAASGKAIKRVAEEPEDDEDNAMIVDPTEEESLDASSPSASQSESSPKGWVVVGIVKKKIIFSNRPMPVIEKR